MNGEWIKRAILGIMGMLLLPMTAAANDGMPPSIFNLIQEGQNVKVTLQIADPGDPGIGRAYALQRNRDTEAVTVFEDHTFDPSEAVFEDAPTCRWWDPLSTYCIDFPEHCSDCDGNGYGDCFGECVVDDDTGETHCEEHADACDRAPITCSSDCDGDGTNDCDGWCRTIYRFDVIDACVPAGDYEYALLYKDAASEEWHDLWTGTPSIAVTDSGKECESDPNGWPGNDTVDDDDDSGCSVITPGAASRWVRLLEILL